MTEITLPKGAIVHISGIPFQVESEGVRLSTKTKLEQVNSFGNYVSFHRSHYPEVQVKEGVKDE